MIKEKSEKGPDGVKEEPGSSEKEPTSTELHVKKEDDPTGSNCAVKKEPNRPITKNGGIIGSTNTGSLHGSNERKSEPEETSTTTDTTNIPLKTEECIEPELPNDPFGLNLPSAAPAPHAAPPDGVQPLASNVISKQPNNMEVQYMQQQSQIFVFSTILANSGADEVLQGRYPSIIAYHCAQPGTKKYLEKNPLKMTQFNRQNPAQWLNNLAMMKNKGCTRSPGLGPKNQAALDSFLGPETLEDMVGLTDSDLPWEQKNNHHLESLENVGNGLPDVVPDMESCSPNLGNVQPSLQGVKVPDENLTPQQRQHREEQLATIRKMHAILFPENQNIEGGQGNEAMDMQHGMMPAQSGQPPGGNMPPNMPNSINAQMEWQKLQSQYYEDRKMKQDTRPMGHRAAPPAGPRLQGPPPPYHQTPRSASVPIALQSPSPASPNNPTSNLSLPSPRASSALNSPADSSRPFSLSRHMNTRQSPTLQDSPQPQRLNHSNPGTPVSPHVSPSVTCSTSEPTTSHQSTDGIFGRTLQSIAQQKQLTTTQGSTTPGGPPVTKEPNLMPVPSPQQIQYLNTFEGQELIIQKQPNTSLKEGNMISSPVLPTTMDSGFGGTDLPHTRVSCPNTPTSMDVGPRFPSTPNVPTEGCRFQISSPHTPTTPSGEKTPRLSGPGSSSAPGLSPQTLPGPTSDPLKNDLFPTPSPHMMDVPRFPGPSASPGSKMGNFVNVPSSAGKPSPLDLPNYGCVRAQMSQQLTNSVASSLNGQGNQGPGMINFSPSMHMMELGSCHGINDMDQGAGNMMGMPMQGPPHGYHPPSPMGPIRSLSPKLQGAFPNHMSMPRMIGRPPVPNPYNGANVQVKPNAPNTIQYLPAKSQVGNATGPRGPPSLDFLQRFANPLSNMENKIPSQNLQYFPNCNPTNGPMQGPGPMPPHMGHMDGPMPDGPIGPMMGGPLGNGAGPMMSGGMGIPSGMMMMRGPMRPPPNMMRMPQMGFNGPPGGGPDGMFNPGPNMPNPNAQMFVSGPKGSPMGMAPDASQPLPPSMGQNNSFKNSPFVGPTTADPNYAQQYHNFQQQLYATTPRSQIGGQTMGPGPGPPHTQQPPYFNPK
ncbi:B-cell lymphoma 9 protein [Popillia japonica]|uniref:B-cell lymphoma 9 protein n=1 Tax=Popillia japonica TaxID=7064 RepID=A0AAW1N074_POPJA